MRFTHTKRRGPPSVIIVSLIDVLIVVLIFMMVATTFRQHPAMKLALPESSATNRAGNNLESLVITVGPKEPHFYIGERAVTYDKLREEMRRAAERNPKVIVSLRADKDAPFGQIVRVMDAAKDCGVKAISAFTKAAGN